MPVHTMKAYSDGGGIAPFIIKLAINVEWLAETFGRVTCGLELRYSFNRRKLGTSWRREDYVTRAEFRNTDVPNCSLDTTPTELHRLRLKI